MRRLMVGMMVAGLLSMSTGGVLSSGSVDEPDGRTIALPDAGISVTFPLGWRIEHPLVGPPPPAVSLVRANDLSADHTGCDVLFWEGASSPAEVFEQALAGHRADEQYEEMVREDLALAVGSGLHVVWRYGVHLGPVHHYYVATPTGVVNVSCSGRAAPPLDAWLGIVASIEALPASETQAWTFEPRNELPALGFAIDFPADWTVVGSPDAVLLAIQSLMAADRAELGECWLEDHSDAVGTPGPQAIDDWLDERVDALAWMGEPVVTRVHLPSGPSGRLEWVDERETMTKWLFIEDGKRLLLHCHAQLPPGDHWLSIAETFEWLPAGE